MTRKIAVLVGSLRKGSFNRKIADALAALAPGSLSFELVEIGDLPFYNQDIETDAPPPAWTRFRAAIKGADAVLFVTPEYNRSVPAVLKNAIDVGSRPYGANAWQGKPAAVISSSMGAIGGFGANHHLRQSLAPLGAPILPQEAYLSAAHELFDDAGALKNETTREFLAAFAAKFAVWIETVLADDARAAA